MVGSDPVVGLSAAIQALREQLAQARRVGWFDELGFEVQPVELTIQAVVEKDVNGTIGWGVLSVGGDYKASTTHTLKLTLKPVLRRPDGTVIPNPTIAGQQKERPTFGKQSPAGADTAEPDPAGPETAGTEGSGG